MEMHPEIVHPYPNSKKLVVVVTILAVVVLALQGVGHALQRTDDLNTVRSMVPKVTRAWEKYARSACPPSTITMQADMVLQERWNYACP